MAEFCHFSYFNDSDVCLSFGSINNLFPRPKATFIESHLQYAKETHAKIKCQKNVNVIYQVYQHTEKVMKYKKTKEKSESVTVPNQFKTPESQNGMFFLH